MIRLDARLAAVKSLVKPGAVAADIGCDHGRLACALAEDGTAAHVYACDVNEKPLARAHSLIDRRGLSDKVETVLTNGLSGLPHDTIDTFIVAGMGGDLIAQIILAEPWTRDKDLDFILQPMTRPENLRQKLYQNGFTIKKEIAVLSGKKVYTVIYTKYTNTSYDTDMLAIWTGQLFDCSCEAARRFLARTASRLAHMADGALAAGRTEEAACYRSLARQIHERIL